MKILGGFKKTISNEVVEYDISGFKVGVNSTKGHFINMDHEHRIKWVIDKVCDHAGGPLIMRGDCAVCPMHNWELDLHSLEYRNSAGSKKQQLPFSVNDNILSVGSRISILENNFKELSGNPSLEASYFRWHNHACIEFVHSQISLITDPWLLGSAFINGWWLKTPSRSHALKALYSADYVYISHNHPDHLHPETLSYLKKDTQILVPQFVSKSTSKYLDDLGFSNVIELKFGMIYELERGFQVSILKSGDFRDDSGLYVACGDKEFLLTVDANYLNGYSLPKNIDYLLTSFAGGASGYPLIYNNFSSEEKSRIAKRNLGSTLSRVKQYLNVVQPKYYMPYAGMFATSLSRDNFITDFNPKNDFTLIKSMVESLGVEFIEPSNVEKICLNSGEKREEISDVLEAPNPSQSLEQFKKDNPRLTLGEISDYFCESNFRGKQILQIVETKDDFTPLDNKFTFVQFGEYITVKELNQEHIVDSKDGYNVMLLHVRYESFAHLIRNRLPWEDLTIGFQCRIIRTPNLYEADFWYHFTNEYIKGIHKRSTKDCRSCKLIETKLDNI